MLYRHYQIHWAKNEQGEYRWIVDNAIGQVDTRGLEGFEALDDAKRYVNRLMKDQGKENEGFHSVYPADYYVKD